MVAKYGQLTASKVEERAFAGGNPEVGGARIEHHGELLSRGANTNDAIVLGLFALVCRGKRGEEGRWREGRRKRGGEKSGRKSSVDNQVTVTILYSLMKSQ